MYKRQRGGTKQKSRRKQYATCGYMVRLKGFEPLAHGLEGRCSIQLSYRRIKAIL